MVCKKPKENYDHASDAGNKEKDEIEPSPSGIGLKIQIGQNQDRYKKYRQPKGGGKEKRKVVVTGSKSKTTSGFEAKGLVPSCALSICFMTYSGKNICSLGVAISSITDPRARSMPKPDQELVGCLLYTSDAADDLLCVDLGGRRIIK